jgi:hypothetical protein
MQIKHKTPVLTRGFALVITLVAITVSLVLLGSMMYWTASNTQVTSRNNMFVTSEAAAEGATEMALSQMTRDYMYQTLNGNSIYSALIPTNQTGWPIQFQFSSSNGMNTSDVDIGTTNWMVLGSVYSGLYGLGQDCHITATATPLNQRYTVPATVSQVVTFASIPVFQYGVFYNMNMDFSPGQAFTMNGKVFVNGRIYMYPQATATFNDTVRVTLDVTNADDPSDQQNLTSYTQPINYNAGTPQTHVPPLVLPIGTNINPAAVEAILNLPPANMMPPDATAYSPTGQVYLMNRADLIISNSPSAWTNMTVVFQDDKRTDGGPTLYTLTNYDVVCRVTNSGVVSTNYLGFSFATNASFYDYREGKTVKAIQIDVTNLCRWLANTTATGGWTNSNIKNSSKGQPIDSIYVYNMVPMSSSQLPAVRVVNGAQLPNSYGLTIATPMPLYVKGDFNTQTNSGGSSSAGTTNTAYTYPAALMGDAITVLSGNWNDVLYTASYSLNSRTPKATTLNAACLEGIVVSVTDGGGNKHYSGGLENFLRLLENWNSSSTVLTYNGSIVVLFPSIYATNYWQGPGNYYNVPQRKWGFDANFSQQGKLPPIVPQTKALLRKSWNAY